MRRSADSLAAVFDTALTSATQPRRLGRPKVLLLVWEQPPMTIGREASSASWWSAPVARTSLPMWTSSSGVVSIEAVAARDPDLIFTTVEGPQPSPAARVAGRARSARTSGSST